MTNYRLNPLDRAHFAATWNNAMPIYGLEPIESFKDHGSWRASGVGSMVVWLRARDEDDARRKMQLATITSTEEYEESELLFYSPWFNSDIVSCDEDNAQEVPNGMALLGNGGTIKI
jgi:hypothetical protein